MHNKCIFRPYQKCGMRCKNKTRQCQLYCRRHCDAENHIYDFLELLIKNDKITSESELYEIFEYIYELNDYDHETTKEVFENVLNYLFPSRKLHDIFKYQRHNPNKSKFITDIFIVFMNTISLSCQKNVVNKIIKIQRCIRNWIYKLIKENDRLDPENVEDPFTYDEIEDIPVDHKFSYKDSHMRVYVFDATELEFYISNHSKQNPYTREDIPNYIIDRLYLLIKYNRLNLKSKNRWNTALQAYTDASQCMEKAGFYNNVIWYEKLNYETCKNVLNLYRLLTTNIENNDSFFSESFILTRENFVFEFCEEMITLFENYENSYLLCCNFLKSIALYINEFYENLPSWVFHIESDIDINFEDISIPDSTSMFVIYLNEVLRIEQ
jgi:hypothetical protein